MNNSTPQPSKKKRIFKATAFAVGLTAAVVGSVKHVESVDWDAHNRRVAEGQIAKAERTLEYIANCPYCRIPEDWWTAKNLRDHKAMHALNKQWAERTIKEMQEFLSTDANTDATNTTPADREQ